MRELNVDVKKLDKTAFYEGKKGTYVTLRLLENKDGRDQYGNDGFVVQGIPKERRDAGERGPIVGNWKEAGKGDSPQPRQQSAPAQHTGGFHDSDDIPFSPFEKACRVPL